MPLELPFIDEFDTPVEASAATVFLAVSRSMGRAFEGPLARIFSAILGCVNRGTSLGVPLVEGQEGNGFRVAEVEPPTRLVLEGQHRFASYRLSFIVDPLPGNRAKLRARTDALFPGIKGAAYRALVIGSGGHEFMVRRMLAAIATQAERLENAR